MSHAFKMLLLVIVFPIAAFAEFDGLPVRPFEMKNVPVSEFVHWYATATKNNVILGAGIEGRISAYGSRLRFAEIDHFFNRVMRSHGFEVTRENGVITVTPGESSENVIFDPDKTGFIVYNFEHIDVTRAVTSLRAALSASIPDNFVSDHQTSSQVPVIQASSTNSIEILPSSNGVIVVADIDRLDFIRSLMPEIDTRQKQVLVEAVILETDITDAESLNFDLTSALAENGFSFVSKTANVLTESLELDDISAGGHLVLSSGGSIRGLVSALSTYDNNKILSTPKLLVMDRERGYISVGQNVPFLVGTETTSGGNTIQRIDRRDVGLSLAVTPVVIGNSVKLTINQTSSSVTSSTQARDIITNQRTISTTASVLSGESIVLGGMISDEQTESESGIPGLKKIPFLGRLFRSDSSQSVQRELSIILKTQII